MTSKQSKFRHEEVIENGDEWLTLINDSEKGIRALFHIDFGREGSTQSYIPHWAMREIYEFIRRQDWEYTLPSAARTWM